MEFNEKLQTLRKQKGVTQEELAESLFVSRTAISKWESARGYPNIESLKAIANFFGVTIDELLSGKELLTIAEEDTKQKKNFYRDLVFGLLDICVAMFFFLPFFRQTVNGNIEEASYPSSTTLLVMCIMPTAIMQINRRIKNNILKNVVNISIIFFIVFMVTGRLLSGVHWVTDIIGGVLISAGFVMLYNFVIYVIMIKIGV